MKRQIFSYAAIAAMCSMPSISFAEDKTVGERLDKAVDKVADAVTPDKPVNDQAMAPKLPAGITAKDNDDLTDVRSGLVTIVNRTLTEDEFSDAVSYLANQDRDRINAQLKDDANYQKTTNAQANRIRALFKQKYGEDFELKSSALDTATAIQQGEVADAGAARAHWPLQVTGNATATVNNAMDAKSPANAPANDDPKFENGRDVAVVRFTASDDGKDPLVLSMQHELPDYWVLDLPGNVNSAALVKSTQSAMQKLIDKQDTWPQDKAQAYRKIAHTILSAYLNTNATGADVANMPRD
jgi:hypothetical protein